MHILRYSNIYIFLAGYLEVKLPTLWRDGKPEVGRVRGEKRRKKMREEKGWEERRGRCAKRWEKSRFTVFFRWFVAPEGREVGSLKRPVRSHLVKWEMKNVRYLTQRWSTFGLLEVEMMKKCTPLCREANSKPKVFKIQPWKTFGNWDVVLCGTRRVFGTLPKASKMWGFGNRFESIGRRGAF